MCNRGVFCSIFCKDCIWLFHKVSGRNDSTNVIRSKVSFKRIFSRYGTHYMFHINFFLFFLIIQKIYILLKVYVIINLIK